MLQNVWDPLFLPNILVTNSPTIQDGHKWMLCQQPSFSSQSPNFGTAHSPNFSYSRRNTEQTSITRFSRSPSLPPSRRLTMNHALAIIFTTLSLLKMAVAEEEFCSAPSIVDSGSNSKHLYWKVTNPTLSPSHLQDLPGFTRSVYKRDHALITPESHVFSPLPEWTMTLGAYLITPAMGSHFVMYLAKMQENSLSGLPPYDAERFIFVVQGAVTLTNVSGISHKLTVDSYAYLPPNVGHSLKCDGSATLVVFERRHASLENQPTEQIVGSTDQQPLLETPGEVFQLRKLIPTSIPYDFNIHIMDFQPGEYLNVKEVHYNQHGLLLLEGQGIYRLGDSWYPVQAGDAIWMAPFVPQWYAALGKSRSRYLLYKDVNRNPL
ncbi:(S)-ureidoglycine aminohydrolase [Prunus yedoensis var. nudiflora]|uniref:(S)-ureidoglycine aminohydrolase n=1 Tax=Prunus yedoensis var. nudiflora TaxID=2094558 RepID=A0A314YX42_PRUYE|nr:(S)-ureidoglycine aminohydrolase [Prunus yedoensis var. nudiflora]